MKKQLLLTAIAICGFVAISMAQVPSYVPTNGLIGYYAFNNNGNDAISLSTPTSNNAVSTTDRLGMANSAYQFNGSNVIKYNGSNPLGTIGNSLQTFSFNFWVNTTNSTGCYLIGAFGWGYYIILTNTNIISLQYMNPSLTWSACNSLTSISMNNWHMITIIKSSSNVMIYIDNTINNSIASVPNIAAYSSNNSFFGANGQDNNGYLSGKLDDIGIWNRGLTQQEIANLYNGCQLSVSTQPINQSVNLSSNAQFIVASSDIASTFQWQTNLGLGWQNVFNAGQYSGANNDTLTVLNTTLSNNNQTFRCIINLGSCADTSNAAILTVINNVGIQDNSQGQGFYVYPNPAKSQINVKTDVALLGSAYTVYDNNGKTIRTGKILSENTVIELGNFVDGIYLFSMGDNLKQTFKVLKQ